MDLVLVHDSDELSSPRPKKSSFMEELEMNLKRKDDKNLQMRRRT